MIVVRSPTLSAVIDPARGGKITSLRSASGEWLAQAGRTPPPPGASFVDAEMAGWDECAPSIVACRVNGRDIPDHGDLWNVPFDVHSDGTTLTATGSSLRYRFRRSIRPTPSGLRLDYQAEALDEPIPFLWAAHPQFAAPPGTHVEVDDLEHVVDVLDPSLTQLAWNREVSGIDTVERGGCRKVYVPPSRPVIGARLVRGDGAALSFRWSIQCPYLGIWFDNGAYSREPVIALEPATAYFDALDTAERLGMAPVIAPGRPLTWWVDVAVSPAAR